MHRKQYYEPVVRIPLKLQPLTPELDNSSYIYQSLCLLEKLQSPVILISRYEMDSAIVQFMQYDWYLIYHRSL
jgi:hypothetical protein